MPQGPTEQDTFLQNIRQLIAADELAEAIQQLQQFLAHAPQLDEIIHQPGRFAAIRRHIRLGTASHEEANLTRNQISHALLELLQEIEAQEREQPALQQEMKTAAAIGGSKNVVVNSQIQASGEVYIGDKHVTQHAENIYNIDKIDNARFTEVSKIPRLLTNPPFNSQYFIGREGDLQAIENEYQNNRRLLVLVSGEGGIGKTTLAAKYWYAHEARYKHLAWLFSDSGIGSALLSLAANLQVTFTPSDDEKAQLARIMEALNNLGKPCLLVLDNANDAEDLDKHYGLLNRLSQCHILLTSRTRRNDMSTFEVKPLDKDEAVQLFRHHYPKLTNDELPLLHDILTAVGYNTLVTELLAKNLAMFNKFSVRYSLSDLLVDLQGQGLLALKNKAVKVMYGSDTLRTEVPNDILAAMYDLAQLSDTERYLLSNLAILPAENIPYILLMQLLQPVPEDTYDEALSSLQQKGWLEYRDADNSIKINPVLQEVTRQKNADHLLVDCHLLINSISKTLAADDRIHKDKYHHAATCARLGEAVIQAVPAS